MPLNISPNSPLIDAANGDSYSVTMSATNGVAPYFWSIASGSLPSGITLSSGGLISGTPSDTPGTYNFNIQVYGSPPYSAANTTTTEAYQLTLLEAITISPASLDDAALGFAYSETLTASGGTGPYTFTKPTGSLPNGLTLSSGGVISGTPTGSATTYNFTIRATDSTGRPSPAYNYSIIVRPRIDIDPDTLPTATVGTAYSQTLSATGGTSPYTWAVTSGSLPAGLTLSGSTISGTPTTEGLSVFTIRVRDNRNRNYFWNYVINVGAAAPPPSGPPTYFISVNTNTINEGGSVVYSISLTNFGSGNLYWSNAGTTTGADFRDGLNEGGLLITDNTGTLVRTLSNDFRTEITETIDIKLRTGSSIGPIVATTGTVTVIDTSNTPRDIVSGVLILDDDFNIIQSRVEEILGLGLDGYGLAAVRSTGVLKSNVIGREQWNELLADMDRISTHVYGTASGFTTITNSVTVITTSRTVDYFAFTNNIYFNDGIRYTCYPGGTWPTQFVEQNGEDIAFLNGNSTSTTTIWYGSMSHIYRMRWATPLNARHYFNTGGIITWRPVFGPGPTETLSDAEWANFLTVYITGGYGFFEYKRSDWVTTATTLTRVYNSGTKQISITAEKNVETIPSLNQYPDNLKLTCIFRDTALPDFIVTPASYTLDPGP